ncbi:MAG: hypothetical protein ACK4ZU_12850, partial [Allorhizobium sp.]
AHVSLSSIFNCQKTDGTNTRQKSLNPTRKPGNKSAIQPISKDFSRAKDFVASSAAALVSERMYRFASPSSQQPSSRILQKIDIPLKNMHFSNPPRKCPPQGLVAEPVRRANRGPSPFLSALASATSPMRAQASACLPR